jgi:hypothetical protein
VVLQESGPVDCAVATKRLIIILYSVHRPTRVHLDIFTAPLHAKNYLFLLRTESDLVAVMFSQKVVCNLPVFLFP